MVFRLRLSCTAESEEQLENVSTPICVTESGMHKSDMPHP